MTVLNKRNFTVILSLAFFNFIFLCTEYLFDDVMTLFVDASRVVMAQNVVLGASVLGFVIYGFVDDFVGAKKSTIAAISVVVDVLSIICTFIIGMHPSSGLVMIAGIIDFILLGMFGSAACFLGTRFIYDRLDIAKTVGGAYALGILVQFINNNLVKNPLVQCVIIAGFVIVFSLIIIHERELDSFLQANIKTDYLTNGQIANEKTEMVEEPTIGRRMKAIFLIVLIVLMTCIFSTLDNAVTLVHASGEFNIGQWPRLILALSGLGAGFLFDLKGRKFMHHMMYVVTLLSAVCVVVLTLGGSFLIGLMVFYLSAGFFVVYFMTSFMELSFEMNKPKLWAGLGRSVNNGTAILISAVSVFLLGKSAISVMILNLVLFALISCVVILILEDDKKKEIADFMNGFSSGKESDQASVEEIVSAIELDTDNEEKKLDDFAKAYGFTPRETDVLRELLSSEDNVQNIANNLGISRAALYRHIGSINEKTDTKSRIGIMKLFFTWR